MSSATALNLVIETQLTSLDDTDCHASAWEQAITSKSDSKINPWGGRGKGGRGLSRRTVQPFDIVVPSVYLEYVGDTNVSTKGKPKSLLQDTTLKLLSKKVYALVGRNGCGKSTLLRRINGKKIPGFPMHLNTCYIPQEVFGFGFDDSNLDHQKTATDVVLDYGRDAILESMKSSQDRLEELEKEMDGLDLESEDDSARVEIICEEMSALDDAISQQQEQSDVNEQGDKEFRAAEALAYFEINEELRHVPLKELSGGQRKKVMLACALYHNPDVLMLDEPTNHLDVLGMVRLRQLILDCTSRNNTTVVVVSHDMDLINDVATDVIHFTNMQKLDYYPGNYNDFVGLKAQHDMCKIRQNATLEKQRTAMIQTIDNLKKATAGKRGDPKKKKALESRKKKLERHGIERDENGHRFTAQNAGTGIREGSINSLPASERNKYSHSQLLQRQETKVAPVPDKEVQFKFRDTTCTWGGEPLIMAMDVGHGYGVQSSQENDPSNEEKRNDESSSNNETTTATSIRKKRGMLFDCVDLCINEKSRHCILGANSSGKSTLLKVLAGVVSPPLEGTVQRAHGVQVCYYRQHVADEIIASALSLSTSNNNTSSSKSCGNQRQQQKMTTALSYLIQTFPTKTEQELRGELTAFGLSPKQATTNISFLSGGERCRLCLVVLMLRNPQVLILDEPTNHLDTESVEALAHGLRHWNGTVLMVTHDANFIRSVGSGEDDVNCWVLMEEEGKLRKVEGKGESGIDVYLKAVVRSLGDINT
eukprot:CAMPEP_0195510028 /NCGR_PEP_ID=MMETSP0794_2-20130614/2787_1 /TAXON_ID=515487 /ORGANISM="Stephanopyxis turris, Strain CCMP 815" /LENGTH=762 /DNA_ID=CAMNT_0040637375 /DNA_START=181 /DNA_END=2469 /DNA_ORIENTATION=+